MGRFLLPLLAASALYAQPAFEVASVKVAGPLQPGARMRRIDPGRVTYRHISMTHLISQAWNVLPWQLDGPEWLKTEYYDIDAKFPEGAHESDVPAMLQLLLKDRFHVEVHRASRTRSAYALIVAPGGPKLEPTRAIDLPKDANGMTPPAAFYEARRTGQPIRGLLIAGSGLTFGGVTLERFARTLSANLDRPVVDLTGIPGEFDIKIEMAPDEVSESARVFYQTSDPAPPSIFTSIRKYGLKLEPRTLPVEYLFVDRADRTATEN